MRRRSACVVFFPRSGVSEGRFEVFQRSFGIDAREKSKVAVVVESPIPLSPQCPARVVHNEESSNIVC